jgi:hypothetical protein
MAYMHERLIEYRNKIVWLSDTDLQKLLFTCLVRAMFISTYLCEQPFSLVKENKSSDVSRLTHAHTYVTKSKVTKTQVLQLTLIR